MMRVIGFGSGGHARVLLEILAGDARYELVGMLAPAPAEDVPVVGTDDDLEAFAAGGVEGFFVGVGSVGDASTRRDLFEKARALGLQPVTIVHPSAVVSPSASIGAGASLLAGCVVGTGATIGDNAIINSGAVVDHDCVIGDHAHVATGAALAGDVSIGEGAHVGVGASIRQRIQVGAGAVVGAGAAVASDVPDGAVVAGVPARNLKEAAT